MRKLFTFLSLLLLASQIVNAQKCKPKITYTDDFTGATTEYWGGTLTSMSVYSLNVKYIPSVYFFKVKDKYVMSVGISVDGNPGNSIFLDKGTTIMFKLKNELLTFTAEKALVRRSRGGTSITLISIISEDDIKKMKNQAILKGRIYRIVANTDILFEFKVSKGRDKKIKKQLNCFLKKIK